MINNQGNNIEIDPIKDVKLIFSILAMMFWFFSKPVEVFIRSGFGERHLKLGWLFGTFMTLNIINMFVSIPKSGMGSNIEVVPLIAFSYLFLIIGIIHNLIIKRRSFNGDLSVMSFHRGNSFGFWYRIFKQEGFFNRLLPNFVSRIVDPAFVLVVGIGITVFEPSLGVFIQFCAVCLFFDEHINWMHARSRFLDQNDARLRSEMDREQAKRISSSKSQSVNTPARVVSSIKKKIVNE